MEKVGRFYEELADILRDKRIEKRISQLEMSERLNVSRTTYANWEQATRRVDIDTMFKICDILDLDINEVSNELRKYIGK